jgi:hypothetical protein
LNSYIAFRLHKWSKEEDALEGPGCKVDVYFQEHENDFDFSNEDEKNSVLDELDFFGMSIGCINIF